MNKEQFIPYSIFLITYYLFTYYLLLITYF